MCFHWCDQGTLIPLALRLPAAVSVGDEEKERYETGSTAPCIGHLNKETLWGLQKVPPKMRCGWLLMGFNLAWVLVVQKQGSMGTFSHFSSSQKGMNWCGCSNYKVDEEMREGEGSDEGSVLHLEKWDAHAFNILFSTTVIFATIKMSS